MPVVAETCAVPGALNPAVTQENIGQTICVKGWTKTVRPPVSYTNRLKRKLVKGLAGKALGAEMRKYELDHCVPLELGGCPDCEDNLWLQPWDGKCGAHVKDHWENTLKREVCSGQITLDEARKRVKTWCE